LDDGDSGAGKFFQKGEGSLPEMMEFSDSFLVQAGKFADIRPRSEAAALTEKDKGSDFRIVLVCLEPPFKILQNLAVDRIKSRGAVQGNPEDFLIFLKQNQRHFFHSSDRDISSPYANSSIHRRE
jgi:hypothetical protein